MTHRTILNIGSLAAGSDAKTEPVRKRSLQVILP